MGLRAKITDAVYDHPRADDQINAVMGVVEARVWELEAENQKLRERVAKWESLKRLAAEAARPDLTRSARDIAKEEA